MLERVRPDTIEARDFGNYRCALVAGRGEPAGKLIISMASRRPEPDGVLRYEWSRTLERLSLGSAILYVIDRTNSWYTDEDGWDDLCAFIREIQTRLDIDWTVCLGLSMGGYGSLLLGAGGQFDRVLIDRIVALATQTCIGPSAPFDWRFQDDWRRLQDKAVTDAAGRTHPDCEYVLCTPCDDLIDVAHLAKFQSAVPRALCLVAQGDHHFSELRATGALDRLLVHLLSGQALGDLATEPRLSPGVAGLALRFVEGFAQPAIEDYLASASREDRFVSLHVFQHIWRPEEPFPARRHQDMVRHHSDHYMVKGWSPAETWGRWAEGLEHTIAFKAVDFGYETALFLALDFLVYGRPNAVQRVCFTSSGRQVLDLCLPCEMKRNSVLIPIFSAEAQIAIDTPDAMVPNEIDAAAGDARRLSIGILAMKIVTASDLISTRQV